MGDIVGGKPILSADEVIAVEIELIDRLPLIFNCAVLPWANR